MQESHNPFIIWVFHTSGKYLGCEFHPILNEPGVFGSEGAEGVSGTEEELCT